MMLRGIGLLLLALALSLSADAQYRKRDWQTYVCPSFGMIYYVGDLTANSLPDEDHLRGMIGLGFAHQYKERFTAMAGVTWGTLTAEDQHEMRGFDFRTTIVDLELLGKLTLLNADKKVTPASDPIFHPRLVAGMGLVYFNPTTEYNGQTIVLRELGTAGQYLDGPYPEPYGKVAFSLKLGVELNVQTGPRTGVNFFGHYSFAKTDYLDDVGSASYIDINDFGQAEDPALLKALAYPRHVELDQTPGHSRGNPESNDGYFQLGVSFNYRLTEPARMGQRRF